MTYQIPAETAVENIFDLWDDAHQGLYGSVTHPRATAEARSKAIDIINQQRAYAAEDARQKWNDDWQERACQNITELQKQFGARSDWKPIVTAPKDGRVFLAANHWCCTSAHWTGEEFHDYKTYDFGGPVAFSEFTHWQDFPELPKGGV